MKYASIGLREGSRLFPSTPLKDSAGFTLIEALVALCDRCHSIVVDRHFNREQCAWCPFNRRSFNAIGDGTRGHERSSSA